MDPTLIGIFLTSMALSAVLILLLKLNFFSLNDGSKPAAAVAGATGATGATGGAIKNANNATKSALANGKSSSSPMNGATKATATSSPSTKPNCVKQVHFSEIILTRTLNEPQRNNNKHNQNNPHSKQHQNNGNKSSKKNKNNANTNTNTYSPNQTHQNHAPESNGENSPSKHNQQHDETPTPTVIHQQEPEALGVSSSDELESSGSLEVLNPNKTSALNNKQKSSNTPTNERKLTTRRTRQNSDQISYSSEKLFSMIAASHLSNDEVQLAVETLLNKLDSAESEWRRPKSDPMQRLKNQLRDTETNLSTETQNHKQTRARLNELKIELQTERLAKNSANEELVRLTNELNAVNVLLEKSQHELSQHKSIQDQFGSESSQLIGKLEQDNAKLQELLANKSDVHGDELTKLHSELEDRENKLKHYELANQNLTNNVQELKSSLQQAELKLDQILSSKRRDDYEARSKVAELESSRLALDEALKEQIQHLTEVTKTNNLLENSVKELQIMNGRQDDMLKRMHDERHVNEQSLKRTLCEMELELRELQAKLSSKSTATDERLREEISHFERELNYADCREQNLAAKMHQLRQGLSELFPDLIHSSDLIKQQQQDDSSDDDWVHQYLAALRQLTLTVNELRRVNDGNNNLGGNGVIEGKLEKFEQEIPNKSPGGSKSPVARTNGSPYSRRSSPNGSSRPNSRATNASDREKKLMETKLVELNDEMTKLKETISELEASRSKPVDDDLSDDVKLNLELQIKHLTLERDKMKTQIKIGLDSFKMEQRRALKLEEELSKYVPIESMS